MKNGDKGYTKPRLWNKILANVGIGLAVILTGFVSTNALMNTYIQKLNQDIKDSATTVVFSSGYDPTHLPKPIIAGAIDFFMYAPITLRQNLMGNKVDWYSNATKNEMLEILVNPQYDNVVFIGHGASDNYATPDGDLTSSDIMVRRFLLKEENLTKKGEIIQYTCGGGGGISLRRVLSANLKGDKGYGFEKNISIFENWGKAWKELILVL